MKHIREFTFLPDIRKYNYTQVGHDIDFYPLPPFNYIANFLEKKGWEIVDYKEIESGLYDTHPLPDIVKYGLCIHAVRYNKPKKDEPYFYRTNKSGGFE